MTINGLGEYGGFYGNYKVVDIPKVDVETVKKQDEQKNVSQNSAGLAQGISDYTATKDVDAVVDKRSKTANLEDISLTFNAGEDFSYLGSEAEIGKLDIQQAISDMKKDSILEDYQYFVGPSANLFNSVNSEDGMVFLKN